MNEPFARVSVRMAIFQIITRSYYAVILLKSIEDILNSLPATCNPAFHRFLHNVSSVKRCELINIKTQLCVISYSLHQVALDSDIPVQQTLIFTSHLLYWDLAMTVYPLSETNVYTASPHASTSR